MNRPFAICFVSFVCWLGVLGGMADAGADTGGIALLLSADTRGELSACTDCSLDSQRGSLARRATLVNQVRKENPSVLLVDAGNSLFWADSMPSKGAVMLRAYAELGYNAVNLSYRDLRLGKEATVDLIETEEIPVVSANLVDEGKGDLLAKPYVVKESPRGKTAILGVTQVPAGLTYLRHLQEQLAGVRIDPPEDAVARWPPRAKDEAERVILLYYGSYAGLEPIRERFGDQLDAILVGGVRPDFLPRESDPPIVGTSERGQHLAHVRLPDPRSGGKAEVTQIAIDQSLQPDQEFETLLAQAISGSVEPSGDEDVAASRGAGRSTAPAAEKQVGMIVIGENLKIGTPLNEVMGLLGMPGDMRSTGTGADKMRWMDYPKQGLFIGARPGATAVDALEIGPEFTGRFASGPQIGDHYQTLLTAHGMPAKLTPESVQYPDKGLEYLLRDEKIATVRMTRAAEIAPVTPPAEPSPVEPPATVEPSPPVEPAQPPPAAGAPERIEVDKEASNKGLRIRVGSVLFRQELAGRKAHTGKTFAVLDTRWENIHPKQAARKGRMDITRGMGGLGFGSGRRPSKSSAAEKDVPVKIEQPLEHLYLLGDGLAHSRHDSSGEVDAGLKPGEPLLLERQGEARELKLAFLIPADAEHLALNLVDRSLGNILVPIRGDERRAQQKPEGLARAEWRQVELILNAIAFRDEYGGEPAPPHWRYAVVGLGGKSLITDSVIDWRDPLRSSWVSTVDGYLYTCTRSETARDGAMRWLPELYKYQELACLVPAGTDAVNLIAQLGNETSILQATGEAHIPPLLDSHRDGNYLEVMVYGARQEGGLWLVDLGIQSLRSNHFTLRQIHESPGLFTLLAGDQEIVPDLAATAALARRPHEPFALPARGFARFELAFDTNLVPTALRFRGFKSQKDLSLALPQGAAPPGADQTQETSMKAGDEKIAVGPEPEPIIVDNADPDGALPTQRAASPSQETATEQALQESEPNDERELASLLPLGESIEGRMEESRADWYRLEVTVPGRNLMRVDLTGVPEVNLRLSLYDAAGNPLKEIKGTGRGRAQSLIDVGVTEGTYYIQVATDWGRNSTDPYRLAARLTAPWREGWELEVNDDREKANLLDLKTPIQGLFQWRKDRDWYRLEVPFAGISRLRIELSGVPNVDSSLALRDAGGQLLSKTNVAKKGGAETLDDVYVTQGTYYVVAWTSRRENPSDSYRIHAQRLGSSPEGKEIEPHSEHSDTADRAGRGSISRQGGPGLVPPPGRGCRHACSRCQADRGAWSRSEACPLRRRWQRACPGQRRGTWRPRNADLRRCHPRNLLPGPLGGSQCCLV